MFYIMLCTGAIKEHERQVDNSLHTVIEMKLTVNIIIVPNA